MISVSNTLYLNGQNKNINKIIKTKKLTMVVRYSFFLLKSLVSTLWQFDSIKEQQHNKKN